MNLTDILRRVEEGTLPAEDAERLLRKTAESNLDFARLDLERLERRGMAEVIFCPGKTSEQVALIAKELAKAGQNVLATRASVEQFEAVKTVQPKAVYHELSRAITIQTTKPKWSEGHIAVVCAGTSDIPVAEEAALTAEWMGVRANRVYDVGVAGLHRMLNHLDELRKARALVVVAGMEGALPSVVGGLVRRPLIAVPTSIGYGSSLHGIAALLAMLNSCVPGVSVVNIDNGFGAGVSAAMICRIGDAA